MITIRDVRIDDYEYFGLSTDEKPTEDVGNAAVFYEMDTSKIYLFDAENKIWLPQ